MKSEALAFPPETARPEPAPPEPAQSVDASFNSSASGSAAVGLPSHIIRTGLLRRLEAALRKKLVLVTAPAGYGKSVLMKQLRAELKNRDCDCVRLAPAGGDPAGFAAAFVDACAGIATDGDGPEPRHQNENASPEAMLTALATWLSTASRDVVIFIDDNEAAQSEETGRLLKTFLRQAPDHVRIVFAARTEPACGAAKMRLDGALGEFIRDDLAFTPAETRGLFLKEGLSPDAAGGLTAKCLGWPAAVGLARLWLREDGGAASQAARFSGARPMIAAYIGEETLAELPAEMIEFLTQAALFDEIDADLANAALARRDSAAMLARLDHFGGLVFPVHGAPGRYRQHPLLADYFRDELFEVGDDEMTGALHQRAAAYFARCGAVLEALEHAVEAGDRASDRASGGASDGALVETILNNPSFGFIAMTADRVRFRRLMTHLEDAAPGDARLAPGGALRRILEGRPEDAKALLRESRSRRAAPKGTAPSVYAAADTRLIDALYHLYTDSPDAASAIAGLEKARGAGAMEHGLYEGVLHEAIGVFQFRLGRICEADDMLGVAAKGYSRAPSPDGAVRVLLHRAMIAMMGGDIAGAREFYDEAHEACRHFAAGNDPLSAAVAVIAAALDYEAGEPANAADTRPDARFHSLTSARRALADDGEVTVELMETALRIDARDALARRGLADGFAILDSGISFARARRFERLRKSLMVQKVHLAAAAGWLKAAQEFKAELDRSFATGETGLNSTFGWREDAERAFALIRLDIARGRAPLALSALDKFDRTFQPGNLKWIKLKSGTLRALALAGGSDLAEAAHLVRALVEQGEALGMRAFFLEEGQAARALLDEAARRFSKTKKAETFNAALMKWLIAAPDFLPPNRRPAAPTLSARQLRILVLLARGFDRNAMAKAEETTTHNIQYHLKQMFEAFGVSSSTGLVAEATRLGMVEDGAR